MDSSNLYGRNAFLCSALGGKKDQMEYFVKSNPDILKSVDLNHSNALGLCAECGTLQGTKFLVEEHGFDMWDSSNKGGRNAFLSSALGGKKDQMKYFVKSNPKILKSVDEYKFNALHLSATDGTLQGTKFLVEKQGFDMWDSSNEGGRNAFLLSALGGKTEQMKYFVKKNPKILKSVDENKFNALHLSATDGTLQGTKFLVEKYRFDIFDSSNDSGRNAFHLSSGRIDQMDYFVKCNPDILKSIERANGSSSESSSSEF